MEKNKDKDKKTTTNQTDIIITEDEIKEASERLEKYKSGKISVDNKATENQEWWRIRHWAQLDRQNSSAQADDKPASAWLFNSVINKHADIMDNFPKLNILPREKADTEEADMLSKMIPVIHERNDDEAVYSQAGYDLVIDGGAITGVFWDSFANDGMGEIVKRNVDVHNLFWEPGITNIQDSRDVFHIALHDVDAMKEMYPEHADKFGPQDSGIIAKYQNDDTIDTSDKCEVVDWYYKKTVMVPVAYGEDGEVEFSVPKQILHYCRFSGTAVLYASENVEEYRDVGYYNHGQYPFVIRALFPIKDTPWGFGFVDVMKSPQKYIDALDQLVLKNCMMKANPRWWVNESLNFNAEDFADWSKSFVKVSGSTNELDRNIKQMDVDTIPAYVYNHMQSKIEELKETSGNRDFSQGSTAAGVTAASAIAALQEAGSKLARDVNGIMYRGSREEGFMEVELIRQFYTEPRSFRIPNGNGGYTFATYVSEQDRNQKKAVFDIQISAEKQSPFSRAAQNETAKEMYNYGFFNPQMAEPALACIDMMEFEGKEQVKENIMRNSQMMQQMQMWSQLLLQLDAMAPELGIAVQAGLADPSRVAPAKVPTGRKEPGTAEERAAKKDSDTTKTAKARVKAAEQAAIG